MSTSARAANVGAILIITVCILVSCAAPAAAYDYLNKYYCPANTCIQENAEADSDGPRAPIEKSLSCACNNETIPSDACVKVQPKAWNPINEGNLSAADLSCVTIDMGSYSSSLCAVPEGYVYPDAVDDAGSENVTQFALARACSCPPNPVALGAFPRLQCNPIMGNGISGDEVAMGYAEDARTDYNTSDYEDDYYYNSTDSDYDYEKLMNQTSSEYYPPSDYDYSVDIGDKYYNNIKISNLDATETDTDTDNSTDTDTDTDASLLDYSSLD